LKEGGPEWKRKIDGSLKIGSKSSLWSSYFSNDKLLVPQYFKKSISI
jgi:hypothetical protein